MIARRRAGAPRLIDWTGERCVPWAPDVQVIYEHLHRYLWASQIVGGCRVLDLGSGEGFGSAILAESAVEVIGIDVDERAVEHSQLNYSGDGKLSFRVASATDLSEFGDGSFGVVVAFEIIEHLRDQEKMIAEVARVLADDGVLILSTPERRIYSEVPGYDNPFHVRELTLEELRALLTREFVNTALWVQHVITGSEMTALDAAVEGQSTSVSPQYFVERSGDEWSHASAPVPVYVVAVASSGRLPGLGNSSTLADCGLELVRERENDAARARAAADGLQAQLDSASAELVAVREEHGAQLEAARAELVAEKENDVATATAVADALAEQLTSARAEHVREREDDAASARVAIEVLEGQLEAIRADLANVRDVYEKELDAARADFANARNTYETQFDSLRSDFTNARDTYEAQFASTHAELTGALAAQQELRAVLESRRAELLVAERRVRDAHVTRETEIARMQIVITAERDVAGELRAQLLALGVQHDELRTELLALADNLAAAHKVVRRIDESVTWRAFQRLRTALYRVLGGERAWPARGLSRALRSVGRLPFLMSRQSLAEPQAPSAVPDDPGATPARPPMEVSNTPLESWIDFPVFDEPTVSLIIPLYRGVEMTRACLESIRDHTAGVSYEVILVDDEADAATKRLLTLVHGGTILVNDQNLGYLRSINRGAAWARGRWLALCNNDIEVQPGWLQAMMRCAESAPDIGVVTPKYVYPDGTLNEAGGILWRDGAGVNYGRHDDPARPAYNYRRQVDYGSAAALLVRADLFNESGGYDERYVPMYYEDADLCFRVRQSGKRVMYEPEAIVMHAEGGTAGTDPDSGHKRHQAENRETFVAKWSETLDAEHLPARNGNHRLAADRLATGYILMIDHKVPMWDRDAGSVRMMGMIGSLQDLGFQVTLLPDNLAPAQPYTRELQRRGVEVLYGSLDVFEELRSRVPMLRGVFLSRPPVGARWLTMVRELAPASTVIYDTVDLHWIRESRAMAVNGSRYATAAKVSALRELELAMVRATDATLVVTDVERRTLEVEVPGAQICVVPMLHRVAEYVPTVAGRSGIIFLGGFAHPPNTDAARQLVKVIMPEVWRRLPDVPVTIVGPDPPPEVLSLRQPLVDVAGWVEEVEPLLHASRLMVAPLRFGAGMKGKVTQSLALGLPVVTTPIGAEGLETGDKSGLLVAEEPVELAEMIIAAYTDDGLWEHLSRCGQAAIARTCSPTVAYDVFHHLLSDRANEPAHATRV